MPFACGSDAMRVCGFHGLQVATFSCMLLMVRAGSFFLGDSVIRPSQSVAGGHGEEQGMHNMHGLRLRGGAFGRAESVYDRAKQLSDPNEFYREFGTGPSLDLSATAFEVKPDSIDDPESMMTGLGMWNYPEEERLIGEHFGARVGHRVRASKYLKTFWGKHNWTDWVDDWDHQNDRLGTVVGVTDDGRLTEVKWDEQNGLPGAIDWYATGYLNNFFLSLAEDAQQPEFPDTTEKQRRIEELEQELSKLRGDQDET